MKKARALPGVITIYMSLTLILVSALICTLIESGRIASVGARLRSITYMACDSVFSGYARQVYDDYGVMMAWYSTEEATEILSDYIRENLSFNGFFGTSYANLYAAGLKTCNVVNIVKPTDSGGEPFAGQVYEYMKYFLAEDAAERILSNISIFNQGEKVSAFMDKIEEYRDTFTRVEEAVGRIKEKIDYAKKIAREPSEILGRLSQSLESYVSGDKSVKTDVNNSLNELKETKRTLTRALNNISEETDEYYSCVEDAKGAVSVLEVELDADRREMEDEVYDVVSEQVEELKEKSADTDFDYYLVGANKNTTEGYIEKLDSLDSLFDTFQGGLSDENAGQYLETVENFRSEFSDFNIDNLDVNFDNDEIQTEDDGFLTAISDFFSKGILGFIAGDVSEKTISTDSLPSVTSKSESQENKTGLLEASANKALFGEYILQHFGNCREPVGSALDYQVEYIIAGKDSDRANLSQVVSEIVLIRTGLNMISLLKSSTKKMESLALATSIVGFTGMPVLVKIFQILIMGVWSLAEAIADVKALIEGKKVRTIKDDSDWYISISGLKNFGSDSIMPEGCDRGLTYESYLRILLLAQDDTVQRYRTMDMIQADVCNNNREEFRVSDCIVGLEVKAEYSVPQMFSRFAFVSNLIGSTGGDFGLEINQSYSY